jgi:hypothetical protein
MIHKTYMFLLGLWSFTHLKLGLYVGYTQWWKAHHMQTLYMHTTLACSSNMINQNFNFFKLKFSLLFVVLTKVI